MGKRGPKPMPTALRVARGSAKKNPQRVNASEAKDTFGRPVKPKHIKGVAATKWAELVGILEGRGDITPAYLTMLEACCTAYGHWRECEDAIAENFLDDKAHNRAIKYRGEMYKYLREMGLTPSSRSEIRLSSEQQAQSKWAKYLEGAKTG